MGEKQDLIKRMIVLQTKFTEYERENGVDSAEYYVPGDGHPLDGYRQEYSDLANKVGELAHAEKGSHS